MVEFNVKAVKNPLVRNLLFSAVINSNKMHQSEPYPVLNLGISITC